MRGCLTLVIGLALGVAVMARWWPTIPTGSALTPGSDVRVTLSDGYLTKAVRARISSGGIVAIRGLVVRSAPPTMIVRAVASVGPISAPITVQLQPIAAGGDVQVRIIATRLGFIPVPNAFTGLVAGSINDSLHHILGANAVVTGVSATPRGLDIAAKYP